jgi:hypothetical protein
MVRGNWAYLGEMNNLESELNNIFISGTDHSTLPELREKKRIVCPNTDFCSWNQGGLFVFSG